ncbi:MAG: molybdopterin oxidoreductase family protein, partial [Verrucomicrobiota bacterium]
NHTEGFEDFAKHVESFDLDRVAAETGQSPRTLTDLADLIGSGKKVSFWWTMGVNQGHESTRTAQAIINLALMTGNIGKPGTGANSITGQCNAMGSRLFSNTTGLLGGHLFEEPAHREKVAELLDIPVERIPDRKSDAYDQIIAGVESGKIKGLWVIATNPSHSWIGRKNFAALLEKLDFLVVQDMYHSTETAQIADLVLPAAGWGEKEGTLINSERRIGLVKRVSRAPGVALSDFNIFKLLARYWGCGEMFEKWDSPEAVFRLLQEISKGRPCDISGIEGYDELEQEGGVQWPRPASAARRPARQRRLFGDLKFYRPNGRALFCFEDPRPAPEPPDKAYPLRLLTGRGSSAQWHTQSRTGKSAVLRKLGPSENHVEIHPVDAAKIGIASGDEVSVSSRRGSISIRALVTRTVPEGSIFIPMHEETTNRLTLPVFDPYSRQPSYKSCAVRVEQT